MKLMARISAKWRRQACIALCDCKLYSPGLSGEGDLDKHEVATGILVSGPLSWMYTTEQKDKALLISSNCGEVGHIGRWPLPIRWLDDRKH